MFVKEESNTFKHCKRNIYRLIPFAERIEFKLVIESCKLLFLFLRPSITVNKESWGNLMSLNLATLFTLVVIWLPAFAVTGCASVGT